VVAFCPVRGQFAVLFEDFTERHRVEQDLVQTKTLLEQAQTLTHTGGWALDLPASRLTWTPETYRMHEVDPAAYTPAVETAIAFYEPECQPLITEAVNQAIATGASYDLELKIRTALGRMRWIRTIGTAEWAEGRCVRLVGTIQDITERRRFEEEARLLQAQLNQAQKMESLGSLAGGVAHDMNNVLGAILAMATAHLDTQALPGATRRALETIAEAATRGGRMVKTLLSFARSVPAELAEVHLNRVLQEEVHLLRDATLADVRVDLDLAPDLRPILGDATALTNAFMNLYVNSVDAMPGGGTLTIRTRNEDTHHVEILVADTGAGMAKEVLERALDPFFTTKPVGKGTGLGLPMVYSTVKAHGGRLTLRSMSGEGTQVRILLPACAPAAPAPESASRPLAPSALPALEVLLVDDDDLVQGSTRAMLEVLGHRATSALSGEEALALLAGGFNPDLVILDLNMPGLGGASTLPRLRALLPAVPVLLATGRTDQMALDLVQADPRVFLLSKPFSMRELGARLETLGLQC
jgi:two-component system cell cycle sensor histidine kinase/response regulator CckA